MSPVGAHVTQKAGHLWTDHIRPEVKKDFIAKGSAKRGFVSCPSTDWQPDESDTSYYMNGSRRFSTTSPVSVFHCNANLPHGARVKSVRFSLHDSASPDYVACTLIRTNLATHNETDLAGVVTPDASGDSVRTTTDIEKPVVDNRDFTYALRCALFGTSDSTGFYGGTVGYTLEAAKGVAS